MKSLCTISIIANHCTDILFRIAYIFAKYNCKIDKISSDVTNNYQQIKFVIITKCNDTIINRIYHRLLKLIDIIKIDIQINK